MGGDSDSDSDSSLIGTCVSHRPEPCCPPAFAPDPAALHLHRHISDDEEGPVRSRAEQRMRQNDPNRQAKFQHMHEQAVLVDSRDSCTLDVFADSYQCEFTLSSILFEFHLP